MVFVFVTYYLSQSFIETEIINKIQKNNSIKKSICFFFIVLIISALGQSIKIHKKLLLALFLHSVNWIENTQVGIHLMQRMGQKEGQVVQLFKADMPTQTVILY